MMADSPDLRKQPSKPGLPPTRNSPPSRSARLQWWLQQSKYQPGDTRRYPIVRVWEKNW